MTDPAQRAELVRKKKKNTGRNDKNIAFSLYVNGETQTLLKFIHLE